MHLRLPRRTAQCFLYSKTIVYAIENFGRYLDNSGASSLALHAAWHDINFGKASPMNGRLYIAWLLGGLLLVGCSGRADLSATATPGSFRTGDAPIRAVATVGMVADIVRNVGGDQVDVQQLMGAGVDPHLYKATRDDVQTIMQGDIVFYSGLMLEGKMTDTLVKMARTKPVYAVTELIDEQALLEPREFAGHYDPHVWMDVAAWAQCIDAVAVALSEFDPAHAADYRGKRPGISRTT